jgi:hypothetical protein
MEVRTRPWTESDIGVIASCMRPADVAECEAHGFVDPWDALQYSVRVSPGECWTATVNGEPAALFGVADSVAPMGFPWLLGTPRTEAAASHFVRLAHQFLPRWLDRWPVLMNYVDARNLASVRWLERIGFTVHPAEPHGPHGLLFHIFEIRS